MLVDEVELLVEVLHEQHEHRELVVYLFEMFHELLDEFEFEEKTYINLNSADQSKLSETFIPLISETLKSEEKKKIAICWYFVFLYCIIK